MIIMWQIISPSVRETAALEDPVHSVSVELNTSLMTSYRSERSSIGSFVGQVKETGISDRSFPWVSPGFELSFIRMSADSLKETYLSEKRKLKQLFFENQDGQLYLREHCLLIDSVVDEILKARASLDDLAAFAIGGYGRQELFPSSDLDLLLVFDPEKITRTEPMISAVLHGLWDTGLEIGHQVWSVKELRGLTLDQYQFVLALIDKRPLGRQNALGRHFQTEILPAFFAANRDAIARKIVDLTNFRHQEFDNTIYQLEPDLKLAPGGLRDIQVGRWLTRLLGSQEFLPYSGTEIDGSDTFLKQLRILVHLLAGRNDNRLTHRMQEKVRKYVGYRVASAQSGVESLMKEYFLNARVSYGFCRVMLQVAGTDDERERHPVSSDAGMAGIKSMGALLQVFLELKEGEGILTDAARQSITAALPDLSTSLHFPSLRESIRALFEPKRGLYRVLSEMYDLGVLELLFPEFGTIKARVIWDFYHRYTVDEHSLLAIRNIEALADETTEEDGRFKTLLADTVDPTMVTLALLFHDVGKGRGGPHSDQSARMAARALRRFRVQAEKIDTIVFLIQNHLAMSSVIFRRDLEDEQVILRFADLVRDPEILRLLTLVTYADIKAVGPGTLNEWKRDLLWQLYVSTYRKLTLEYGEDRVAEEKISEQALCESVSGFDRDTWEQFIEGFPARYLRTTAPKEICQHYRMARALNENHPVETRILKDKEYYELCVVTADRPYLFAKIAGLLSYFEMNILRGYGFSNRRQTILDFFQFFDEAGHFRRNHERTRFQELLKKAVLNEVSVERLLQGKEESVLFRRTAPVFDPTIYFEDEHSDRFTIMEIVAPDALGLLYRISREISFMRCDIELALISTEGEKAVDVFYLCHERSKLSTQLKNDLRERIVRAIIFRTET